MFALEKRVTGSMWVRYAVCNSSISIFKVYKGLNDKERWRVVYIPCLPAATEQLRAA